MRALCCLLVAAGAVFGQVDPDTITVVSRSSAGPAGPDTVSYDVDVTAAAGKGLDEVLKALADLGVTERDLTGISSSDYNVCVPSVRGCNPTAALDWRFRFSSPITRLPETLKALAQLAPAGMIVSSSASSGGTPATPECAYPTLISQARRHAENLAAAAGVRVGRLTALSDAAVDQAGDFSVVRYAFLAIPSTLRGLLVYDPLPAAPTSACAVAVQFQLLR